MCLIIDSNKHQKGLGKTGEVGKTVKRLEKTTDIGKPLTLGEVTYKATEGGSSLVKASKAAFNAADDIEAIFIKNKHLDVGTGKFAKFKTQNIGIAQEIVQKALRFPNAQFLSNPNLANTFRIHANLRRVIVTKGQAFAKVVVGFDDKVINAFSIK